MSIINLDINTYPQLFKVSLQNKHKYGEVNTDFALVSKILSLIPEHKFKNPNLTWLDPCCGSGYFSIVLYKLLDKHLPIIDAEARHRQIIKMIHMVEINPEHIIGLKTLFGEKANIKCGNFLTITGSYDMIIGNPPFNSNGIVKVPTNKKVSKKTDGISIWQKFIKKSIDLLEGGRLTFITPSLWMKRDHPMYQYMIQHDIKKVHTMTNTETNKAFHGHAQTPTCYFTMVKITTNKQPLYVPIYDKTIKKYVKCELRVNNKFMSLPLFAQSIVQKILVLVDVYGSIDVIKTSMRPDYKGLSVKKQPDKEHLFPNISTCIINELQPQLVINYSNRECVYANRPKLVLAHKMYGFPYYDASGTYGISNRDNYVILNKTPEEFTRLKQFFYTKFALYVFESTRYRMKYLEKYVFEMIPDITKIPDFPSDITDENLATYFNLTTVEKEAIETHTKKTYKNIN
jgi:tRNA1(Val) A37 N6-methylase TrmN6|uniref:site-specific DNA-methyltransferase (adenine-specific) n=1 Tax=viral metagenome TaxID=1070528 RepID=A0A6C0C4J9_9ZZZZ